MLTPKQNLNCESICDPKCLLEGSETPELPRVLSRGYRRCFGVCRQRTCCTGANEACTSANEGREEKKTHTTTTERQSFGCEFRDFLCPGFAPDPLQGFFFVFLGLFLVCLVVLVGGAAPLLLSMHLMHA